MLYYFRKKERNGKKKGGGGGKKAVEFHSNVGETQDIVYSWAAKKNGRTAKRGGGDSSFLEQKRGKRGWCRVFMPCGGVLRGHDEGKEKKKSGMHTSLTQEREKEIPCFPRGVYRSVLVKKERKGSVKDKFERKRRREGGEKTTPIPSTGGGDRVLVLQT